MNQLERAPTAGTPAAPVVGARSQVKRPLYVCACTPPRKLRMSPGPFAAAPILCRACNTSFRAGEPAAVRWWPAAATLAPEAPAFFRQALAGRASLAGYVLALRARSLLKGKALVELQALARGLDQRTPADSLAMPPGLAEELFPPLAGWLARRFPKCWRLVARRRREGLMRGFLQGLLEGQRACALTRTRQTTSEGRRCST